MQSATLHIKVKPEIAKGLKLLSKKKETSVGELIRQAVFSCYQLEFLGLNQRQKHAIAAFQGGYISLGKLAEKMGMTIWDIRIWLEEHDILQNNFFQESDIENA
ncbi:MAG: hypothetical protein KAH62_03870 [Desulfobacula sp.]|nr:hypothetical protein [Desulfobacula sp.]